MTKIGLLSDTHSDFPEKIYHYFQDVDEIWHAGDIGDVSVIERLKAFKPLRAVYGNIDDTKMRMDFPEFNRFMVEEVQVLMTHIAGKPGNYSIPLLAELKREAPQVLVCGHSHILLVKQDPRFNMLWLNPGACGNKGFHQVKTLLRFAIDGKRIINMEAIEIGKRSSLDNSL
ncbi:MAG: metallophosphoesterase family protein [Fluviicola sp.]|nr:metallophosphoesterase family protein [Fluviicola sp.]